METNKIKETALEYIRDFDTIKYTKKCAVWEYLLYNRKWEALEQLVSTAKKDSTWQETETKLPEFGFFKYKIIEMDVRSNRLLIESAFVEAIEDNKLKNELDDIVSDRRLAVESANEYLDTYRKFEQVYTVEEFLKRYDKAAGIMIDGRKFRNGKGTQAGHYSEMLRRIKLRGGDNWLNHFYSLLPQELGERIRKVQETCSTDENKLNLLEMLAEKGMIGLLETFGLDAYEIIDAIEPDLLKPEDRETMADLVSSRKIRAYLGKCRKRPMPTDTAYDCAQCILSKLSSNLTEEMLDKEGVAQAIVKNLVLERYRETFVLGRKEAIAQIQADINSSRNNVERVLLTYALQHYMTMDKCTELKNVKRKIMVKE